MNMTPNYQLPQWEGSDRVLMEDFNQLCTKLDTAMHGLQEGLNTATRLVKLREIIVPAGATNYTVALSDLQLSRFDYLEIHAEMHNAASRGMEYTLNGSSALVYQHPQDTNFYGRFFVADNVDDAAVTVRLSPLGQGVLIENKGIYMQGSYFYPVDGVGLFHGSSLADLTGFSISGKPGEPCKMQVYGMLK